MRLFEASRFTDTLLRFAIVDSRRFCTAPRSPRVALMRASAASTRSIVLFAFSTVVTSCVPMESVSASMLKAPFAILSVLLLFESA